jgi:hypothetical protein
VDDRTLDRLARLLVVATSRRTSAKAVAGALIAALAGRAPTSVEATCLWIGARCGRHKQPSCNNCCTGFTTKQQNQNQRRCACRPDAKRCKRPDECCSGICRALPCIGVNRPVCVPGIIGGC